MLRMASLNGEIKETSQDAIECVMALYLVPIHSNPWYCTDTERDGPLTTSEIHYTPTKLNFHGREVGLT